MARASLSSTVRRFACVALGLILAGGVAAHHSVAPFDRSSMQELEGEITSITWRNPHIFLTLSVTDESGQTTDWSIEGDSANAAASRGYDRNTLSIGDHVRIAGWPSTRGRREVFLINILHDGVETVLGALDAPLRWTESSGSLRTAVASEELGRSIFRVWAPGGLYRPRGAIRYTPVAQVARDAWDPLTDMLALHCIPPGMPNANMNPYPIGFTDEGERIRLDIEEWEATRYIDMVSEEIPADAPASRLGYSIGRWVGDTLVIETAGMDFEYLDDEGTPMSDEARIVEQYTVNEDGSRLDYTVAVTDPVNLIGPAVWDAHWTYVPGTVIRSFECEVE
ncbi:MAG: DUF6152 family protein [Gammaproteobacteria bacterium]|nr:DUF6152 family protein [Gammaproteobacteria bacterium]MDH3507777.1 DUF6152 family protein [Gammaproteobacteria bacterium]